MRETNIFPVRGLSLHRIQARIGPRFVCQHCNDLITDASGGLVVYDNTETEALVVHKECDAAKPLQERLPLSAELDTFWVWLLWTTGLRDDAKLKWAQEKAKGLLEI